DPREPTRSCTGSPFSRRSISSSPATARTSTLIFGTWASNRIRAIRLLPTLTWLPRSSRRCRTSPWRSRTVPVISVPSRRTTVSARSGTDAPSVARASAAVRENQPDTIDYPPAAARTGPGREAAEWLVPQDYGPPRGVSNPPPAVAHGVRFALKRCRLEGPPARVPGLLPSPVADHRPGDYLWRQDRGT